MDKKEQIDLENRHKVYTILCRSFSNERKFLEHLHGDDRAFNDFNTIIAKMDKGDVSQDEIDCNIVNLMAYLHNKKVQK